MNQLVAQTNTADHPIFTLFPWVTTLIDQTTCATESIEVYQAGVHQYLLITDESDSQVLYYQNGTKYCENRPNFDCVRAYQLGDPIDFWSCEDELSETDCFASITNTTCRTIGIYDENDNFLATLRPGPFGLQPPPFIPSIWEDPIPLLPGEERKYIFKEFNFVLSQQIATCENQDINLQIPYSVACNDGLSVGVFTNAGCRPLEIHTTNSQLLTTLDPGESSDVLTVTNFIFILISGTDTIGVQSDIAGAIDTGDCETDNDDIPNDYAEYDLIFKICQGDTLSIKSPYRDVQCPLTPECINGPGICENFPFRQLPEWTNDTGDEVIVNRIGDGRVLFSPTTTTVYTGTFPTYRCGFGPTGPNGPNYKYLVIVEELDFCTAETGEMPITFNISACIGDIIKVPIPNHGNYCGDAPLFNAGGIVDEIARNSDELTLQVLDAGIFYYGLGKQNILLGTGINRPTVFVSCPLISYNFKISLNSDCEVIETDQIFLDYPWLTSIINPINCTTESVTVYQQGIHRFLLVTNRQSKVLYYQDGTRYCENRPNFDCVSSYNLGEPIETWNCEDIDPSTTCEVELTNVICRTIGVYDENDQLLTTMPPKFGGPPRPDLVDPIWVDDRPLVDNETRTYIFKENNLILGRQTASCSQNEISTISAYNYSCTDALGLQTFTNTGCRPLMAHNTNSEIVFTLAPNETKTIVESLPIPIYIFIADSDTISIDLEGDINSGGCTAPIADCKNNTGTIFFRACDDGQQFYFIETSEGIIYDPYFGTGITFTPIDGQKVNFDFVDATFASPCSIAEKAITITCIEVGENPVAGGDCKAYQGTIIYENCDDGTEFVFVETTKGEIFDLYFVEGIDFLKYPNQQVQFDYVIADFTSPCSIADAAIFVTCIEETSFATTDTSISPIFDNYPFLTNLINPADCQESFIEVYDLGSYAFLFVKTKDNQGQLYFENGDFYCQDAANYDCRAAYNLGEPTDKWTCTGFVVVTDRDNPLIMKKDNSNFKLYPNPTTGQLMLDLSNNQHSKTVQIFNIFGQLVQSIPLENGDDKMLRTIDLSAYENGIYYIQLNGDGLRYTQKVVKQNLK